MRQLQQIVTVAAISFCSLHTRIKSSLVIVVGIGFMVFVLLSLLSIVEGLKLAALGAGDSDRVEVYASNGYFLGRGKMPASIVNIVGDAPGVARGPDGVKLVDAEVSLNIDGLTKRNNSEEGYTYLLGVGPQWPAMTPSLRLLSGRMPRPGARELIAGDLAQRKFSSIDDGFVNFKGTRWRIVGIFVTHDITDGYLVGDEETLKAAANHPDDTYVLARLRSPDKFEDFRSALQRKLPQNIKVLPEQEVYSGTWKQISQTSPAILISFIVAALIGSGMVSGTMHTMRVAVEDRAREIAILRAIGFGGIAVAASVVLEAVLLATLGGLIATALVWMWMDDFLYNGGPGVFAVRVDQHMLLTGLEWALTVALIGALSPAIRAARQTVIESLKDF